MAEAEFCGAEGEVFDAENTGEDDADDVASDESIDSEAKEDGDDLDDDAGKFGETETYVVDANMSQAVYSHCYGVEYSCRYKGKNNQRD